jgi:hypothetical protein
MPALSILELITRDIEQTLQAIRQVNSYAFDLLIERATKSNIPLDSKVILSLDDLENDSDTAMQHDTYFANFTLTAYASVSDSFSQTLDQRLQAITEDIRAALMVDPQRGLYALNSEIGTPIYNPDSTDFPHVSIPYRVHFRTLRGRPFEI